MSDLALRAMIKVHLAKARAGQWVRDGITDEQGEMGSWLIVAAGLAIAAAAVVEVLDGWFTEKAEEIKKN